MSISLDCTGIDCWQELFDESLALDQLEQCERHLESCPTCRERLCRGEDCDDALLTLARQVGDPTVVPADPILSQFIERVCAIKPPEPTTLPETADLSFLRRVERPGVLGMLDGYEIQGVIGKGGMGIVLKAFEPALRRHVAIKVMWPFVSSSVKARQRFIREAKAAAAVSHDHVVAVHGAGNSNGLPYLVMQYVPGQSLQSRLDCAARPEMQEIVRIGWQTALGLAAAHGKGLIHRDVKPANLLMACGRDVPDGTDGTDRTDESHWSHLPHSSHQVVVKITDFGLARLVDDVSLTQNGVVAGTPEYMAPEQARGETIDHRADLFSLGSVLYALCTGVPPFRGSSALSVLRQVSDSAPTRIRDLNPDVPTWLEALIAKLMAKNPADRFQSAVEVAALLEGYNAHLEQSAPLPAFRPSFSSTPNNRREDLDMKLFPRRRYLLCLLCLLLGLGLGLALVVLRLTTSGQESADAEDFLPPVALEPQVMRLPDGNSQIVFAVPPDGQRCGSYHSPDGKGAAVGKCSRLTVVDARDGSARRWIVAKEPRPADKSIEQVALLVERLDAERNRLIDVEQAPDSTSGGIKWSNAWLAAALIIAMMLTLTASVWLFLFVGRRGGHGRSIE